MAIPPLVVAGVTLLNLAFHVIRFSIAADLQNKFINGSTSTDFNAASEDLIESAIISALIGITSVWLVLASLMTKRNGLHDAAHALDVLAFLFTFYSLGYATKQIDISRSSSSTNTSVSASPSALAGLSILQVFLQFFQLIVVVIAGRDPGATTQ